MIMIVMSLVGTRLKRHNSVMFVFEPYDYDYDRYVASGTG